MFQILLQLLLTSLALAAPVQIEGHQHGHGDAWQYGTGGGIIGFIVLILDIIVFIEVLKSARPVPQKLLWCLLVFLFPIGGIIIYYIFAERTSTSAGYEPISS